LEASTESLRHDGAAVPLAKTFRAVAAKHHLPTPQSALAAATLQANGSGCNRRSANANGHVRSELRFDLRCRNQRG